MARLSCQNAIAELDKHNIRVSKMHGRYVLCDVSTGKVYENLTGTDVVRVAKNFMAMDQRILALCDKVAKEQIDKATLRREHELEVMAECH